MRIKIPSSLLLGCSFVGWPSGTNALAVLTGLVSWVPMSLDRRKPRVTMTNLASKISSRLFIGLANTLVLISISIAYGNAYAQVTYDQSERNNGIGVQKNINVLEPGAP